MKRIIIFFVTIILAVSLSTCAKPAATNETAKAQEVKPSAAEKIEVTDFKDRKITLDKIPQRIVSLSPSNTEILFALGAGDRVVGVTSYDDYPEEVKNIEKVGTFEGPNMELIKKVQPDVVLAGYIQEETVKSLESMGIPVIVTEAESFDSIYDSIKLIGKVAGTDAKAEETVQSMKSTIEAIASKTKDKKKPTVFYVVWTDPLTTAGAKTFINDVIKAAGGINVAEKVDGWAKYSAEELVKDNPDMLISALHSTDKGMSKEDISNNPIFRKLESVRKGNVYIMSDDNIISRPGPRIVQAVEEMSKVFFGE
ncbi:MAG: ABC transporter substrate-binding protein [Caulobacteraceae bacterium]